MRVIESKHAIGSFVMHHNVPTRIGCAIYEHAKTYKFGEIFERVAGTETLEDAFNALDPFQDPANYGYERCLNISLAFRVR